MRKRDETIWHDGGKNALVEETSNSKNFKFQLPFAKHLVYRIDVMSNGALTNESVRTRFGRAFSIAHDPGAGPSPGHEQVQQYVTTKFEESRWHKFNIPFIR